MRLTILKNDALWTEQERDLLIGRALDIFLEKRRSVALDQPLETPELEELPRKRVRMEESEIYSDDNETETESEESNDEDDSDSSF